MGGYFCFVEVVVVLVIVVMIFFMYNFFQYYDWYYLLFWIEMDYSELVVQWLLELVVLFYFFYGFLC